MQKVCAEIDRRYGAGTVELTLRDSYFNMREKIEPCMFLIENAKQAMEQLGIEPKVVPPSAAVQTARGSRSRGCRARTSARAAKISTAGSNISRPRIWSASRSLAVMLWNLAE